MEKSEKNKYVSPSVEVNQVFLEGNIAVQSPVRNVNVEDWGADEEIVPDTGDIFIAI